MSGRKLELEDWLDDLCVRFIINLPQDDLSSVPRICFQVEEAQWYYEDFIRPLDPSLPTMNLRTFCLRIFAHCPLLSAFSQENHISAFEDWLQYKIRVPVRGAILLNDALDSVLLVKGWKKGATWSFPRGKINKDEDDLDCATREVYEETGYDLHTAGLVPTDRHVKHIEINMREQNIRLYVFKDVPMNTCFEPRTRKEISKIQWWRLSDLPGFRRKGQQKQPQHQLDLITTDQKFYVVAPFLAPLKKWILEQKKGTPRTASNSCVLASLSHDEPLTEEDQGPRSYQADRLPGQAPNKAVLENATATLKGLLRIQPPTEGLQLDSSQLVQPSALERDNKGAALLALLKPAASSTRHAFEKLQAHTEQNYEQPFMPRSPHHDPLQRHQNIPPTPSFLPRVQHGVYPYNQHAKPARQFNVTTVQDPQFRETILHKYPLQQFDHSQPMPLHGQSAVSTSGMHSPMALPHSEAPIQQSQGSNILVLQESQFSPTRAPLMELSPKQPQVQLTSHKLALLNAFQSRDQSADLTAPGDLPLRRYAQEVSASPPVSQPQELPAETTGTESNPFPSPFGLPHSIAPAISSEPTPSKTHVTNEHQSTLLSIFKNPVAIVPSPALPPSATALPVSRTPSAVELSAAAPLDRALSKLAVTPVSILKRGQPRKIAMDQAIQELTSETRASKKESTGLAQLLQRQTSRNNEGSQKSKSGTATLSKGNMSKRQQSEKPFQPQILKRPQSMSTQSPAVSPPQLNFDRRPSAPTEHVQALLSLFGKAPPVSHSSTTAPLQAAPIRTASVQPQERSRNGNGIVVLNNTASRRSNPISPADKGFLLGYLDAVAKSGAT